MADTTNTQAPTGSLNTLKLAELQALASQEGVKGTSKMRKADLVAAIQMQRATKRVAKKEAAAKADAPAPTADAASDETATRQRAPRRAQRPAGAGVAEAVKSAADAETPKAAASAEDRAARLDQLADAIAAPREKQQRQGDKQRQQGGQQRPEGQQRQQGQRQFEDDFDDRSDSRRRRGRDRNRNKRNRQRGQIDVVGGEDVEVREDDVLIPIAGILDVNKDHAFVRTSGYLPGPNDVYVSLNQVRKSGLRRGDAVVGAIRAPRDGDQMQGSSGRVKFNALVRLDSVNGMTPDEARTRPNFNDLTPLYPQERLRLESPDMPAGRLTPRVIDIVAPIGKGQRGLIVS
ncbi:MAG: Rho termination factor N-terminal domain-containing protein, partial [Promicromonosporaceae bacterium]|nr:Rho termination factor N-terminal domain-containing protein [Promicromonosporaceae bacterium]